MQREGGYDVAWLLGLQKRPLSLLSYKALVDVVRHVQSTKFTNFPLHLRSCELQNRPRIRDEQRGTNIGIDFTRANCDGDNLAFLFLSECPGYRECEHGRQSVSYSNSNRFNEFIAALLAL